MSILRHRKQFEKVLKNYHPHEDTKAVLAATDVALLMGLSASGRNTLIQTLLKTGDYHYIISDTTRAPRVNGGILEQNGVEYWFKTEEQVLDGLEKGNYIEAAIIHNQQVSGVSVDEIKKAKLAQQIAITDVQQEGVDSFRTLKPDVIAIFVIPPSYEVWMERLAKRGKLIDGEFERRRESAISELEHLFKHDYKIVVNDKFEDALKKTRAITKEKGYSTDDHQLGMDIAKKIYAALTT